MANLTNLIKISEFLDWNNVTKSTEISILPLNAATYIVKQNATLNPDFFLQVTTLYQHPFPINTYEILLSYSLEPHLNSSHQYIKIIDNLNEYKMVPNFLSSFGFLDENGRFKLNFQGFNLTNTQFITLHIFIRGVGEDTAVEKLAINLRINNEKTFRTFRKKILSPNVVATEQVNLEPPETDTNAEINDPEQSVNNILQTEIQTLRNENLELVKQKNYFENLFLLYENYSFQLQDYIKKRTNLDDMALLTELFSQGIIGPIQTSVFRKNNDVISNWSVLFLFLKQNQQNQWLETISSSITNLNIITNDDHKFLYEEEQVLGIRVVNLNSFPIFFLYLYAKIILRQRHQSSKKIYPKTGGKMLTSAAHDFHYKEHLDKKNNEIPFVDIKLGKCKVQNNQICSNDVFKLVVTMALDSSPMDASSLIISKMITIYK